ncbi:hypothetical protein GCM10009092_19220 [Bowmanella denitrificans]|uniref:Phasin domain-containing protein n=1 Tax=Bowmanella denitrificans TaxID=366582 RepID=A0ABN0X4Q4_9ALTE|nr:hypothetical protein [Bowmanella denitrificans]
MSFASALKSIGNGIKDLSQLNVRTYTGNIDAQISGENAEEMLNLARQNGQLKLVGLTTINLDGDVNQFISSDQEINEKLHNAHQSAVQASQRSREVTFNLFASAIREAVGKISIDPNQD